MKDADGYHCCNKAHHRILSQASAPRPLKAGGIGYPPPAMYSGLGAQGSTVAECGFCDCQIHLCKSNCRAPRVEPMSRSIGSFPATKPALHCQCRVSAATTAQMLHIPTTSGSALTGMGQDTWLYSRKSFLFSPTASAVVSDGIAQKKAVVDTTSCNRRHGSKLQAATRMPERRQSFFFHSRTVMEKRKEEETGHM